jgi:hypothetical protein
MQMHEPYSGITMDLDKERKVLDRVTTHQLIILENPPLTPIEEIKIKSSIELKKEMSTKSDSQ